MSSFLPQFDPDPEKRSKDLADCRKEYEWEYNYVSPLATVRKVPHVDEFSFKWLAQVGERALEVLANHIAIKRDDERNDFHRRKLKLFRDLITRRVTNTHELLGLLQDSLFHTAEAERPESIDDYADLFRKIGLPAVARDYQEDKVFAYMRIAGPNPVLIQQIRQLDDRFPVTDAMYSAVMPDDSLAAAGDEGRLFLADYAGLAFITDGSFPRDQKYIYAPLALFAVDKTSRDLMPVAIQCEQTPAADNPVFTPDDGFNWLIAKTIVEMADGNYHEAVTHLGRTHLFIEPFVIATHRQLSVNHPLSMLLRPHFEGTLAINNAAHERLISDRGNVDRLTGGTIDATRAATTMGIQTYLVNDAMLPLTFAARGVADTEILPVYPYRDDSLLYWHAIRPWVADYLRIWYRSDSDLAGDFELASWFVELKAHRGGRVRGLSSEIGTFDYLVDVATLIIFTSSVQHAAVNFPQYDLMSYCPNMPLACYAPRPTQKKGGTEADYLDILPPLDQAELQLALAYILGSVHYTTLGDYGDHFANERVDAPLKQFNKRLAEIKKTIQDRNRARRPYKFLLPSGVPQSINI